jgi:hypothetical protein
MGIIVTDKVARRQCNFRVMIEIELPCCGTATYLVELADSIDCETCGVVLNMELPEPELSDLLVAA